MLKLELAQMSNNEELIQFFAQFPLESNIQVKLDRGRDYFRYYQTQTDQYLTYILRNIKEGRILGVVSFLIETILIEGEPVTVAWARDLRIAPDRRAILTWAEHTHDVFKEVKQIFGVKYVLTTLNMNEAKVLNTFTRSRTHKRSLPRYFLYRKFDLVTVHGQFPLAQPALPSLKIRRGNPNHKDLYIKYILEKSKSFAMTQITDEESLLESVDRWDQLSWEDFFVAFDSQDKIVGLLSSWSSAGFQDYIPLRYNLRAHNFRQFLKFGKIFKWTRTLTKPFHRIKIEAALNFRMLNHIFVDHPDVFSSLLWKAFAEARDNEFLVYLRDRKDLHLKAPMGWISSEQTHGIYCAILPDEDVPDFLHPSKEGLVHFHTSRFI